MVISVLGYCVTETNSHLTAAMTQQERRHTSSVMTAAAKLKGTQQIAASRRDVRPDARLCEGVCRFDTVVLDFPELSRNR
jgi:hypothetical protein